MQKIYFISALIFLFAYNVSSQTISNPGTGDSLYPVSGSYYQYVDNFAVYEYPYSLFGVTKSSDKYYINGDFKNLADNNGSSLLIDTNTNNIINNRSWRVNGIVNTVLPDGQGGFFIGGSFNSIGDSSRKNIAQITSTGKPTPWNPGCNGAVNAIVKRNDTLFIGGSFTNFAGGSRSYFAMYSATGNTLFNNGGSTGFSNLLSINALLLQGDTLIYGGKAGTGGKNIRKYNFRSNTAYSWSLSYNDFSEVKELALSNDKTVLIYAGDFNDEYLKGAGNIAGNELYHFNITATTANNGNIKALVVVNNKAYVAGNFSTPRKGFFVFDPISGALLPDNINLDGFASFLYFKDNKMFISGKFTTVGGISRDQFAMLDTGTYALNARQLSISDPLTAMAFNNNIMFAAGSFTGLNAVRKNGIAAIDINTHELSGWNAIYSGMNGCKRMFIRGDSLFVLAAVHNYTLCAIQSETMFKIYSLSTGAQYGIGSVPQQYLNDMLLDGNYLYVGQGIMLRRYLLPSLTYDTNWGMTWQFTGYTHSLMRIFSDATNIYAIGDSRFSTCSSTLDPKRGFVDIYNKATGLVTAYYPFEGASNEYDNIFFNQAELINNKMYIQGQFAQLNGNVRRNFACVDLASGSITSWQPQFPVSTDPNSFYQTSKLQEKNGKIWFGSNPQFLSDGGIFYGFGGIDTATGQLVQPLKTRLKSNSTTIGGYVNDFLLTDTEVALAGSFDSVNAKPFMNFAVFPLSGGNQVQFCPGTGNTFLSNINGATYRWQLDTGTGFIDISDNANFSGTQTASLQLTAIPSAWSGYKLRCHVGNAYSDIFEIRFRAIWTGSVNTSWENPANWQCNTLPDANSDVIINNATVIVHNSTTIKTLYTGPGTNLTVNPTVIFTVLH